MEILIYGIKLQVEQYGYNRDCTIQKCTNKGTIKGIHHIGGIAGRTFSNSLIELCSNENTVSCQDNQKDKTNYGYCIGRYNWQFMGR